MLQLVETKVVIAGARNAVTVTVEKYVHVAAYVTARTSMLRSLITSTLLLAYFCGICAALFRVNNCSRTAKIMSCIVLTEVKDEPVCQPKVFLCVYRCFGRGEDNLYSVYVSYLPHPIDTMDLGFKNDPKTLASRPHGESEPSISFP